ncbi:nuclear transport factor 2 family protein [Lysobacter koreensis]|uniref:Nuclear transport factor 2 family protein n=1 Tax=Lysobacter koreensis TaxID=266122 RepID=A0ABW2YP20_9GAMM
MANKATAIEYLRMAAAGEVREAHARHVAPGFTHHNPGFAHHRPSLLDAMVQSAATARNQSFEVLQAIEDADTVAIHSRLTRAGADLRYAVVHILKFDGDGKIVEMWDVVQEVPAQSPNARGMF